MPADTDLKSIIQIKGNKFRAGIKNHSHSATYNVRGGRFEIKRKGASPVYEEFGVLFSPAVPVGPGQTYWVGKNGSSFVPIGTKFPETSSTFQLQTEVAYESPANNGQSYCYWLGLQALLEGGLTTATLDLSPDYDYWPKYDSGTVSLVSNGTQWIDTGYIPNTNTEIMLVCIPHNTSGTSSIFGTKVNPAFGLYRYSSNFGVDRGGGTYMGFPGPANNRFNIQLHPEWESVNNITGDDIRERDRPLAPFNHTSSLILFGTNSAQGPIQLSSTTLYEFVISEDWTELKHFYPVEQGSTKYSDEPAPSNCLWEGIGGRYYENQGTGSFGITGGTAIVPSKYTPLFNTRRLMGNSYQTIQSTTITSGDSSFGSALALRNSDVPGQDLEPYVNLITRTGFYLSVSSGWTDYFNEVFWLLSGAEDHWDANLTSSTSIVTDYNEIIEKRKNEPNPYALIFLHTTDITNSSANCLTVGHTFNYEAFVNLGSGYPGDEVSHFIPFNAPDQLGFNLSNINSFNFLPDENNNSATKNWNPITIAKQNKLLYVRSMVSLGQGDAYVTPSAIPFVIQLPTWTNLLVLHSNFVEVDNLDEIVVRQGWNVGTGNGLAHAVVYLETKDQWNAGVNFWEHPVDGIWRGNELALAQGSPGVASDDTNLRVSNELTSRRIKTMPFTSNVNLPTVQAAMDSLIVGPNTVSITDAKSLLKQFADNCAAWTLYVSPPNYWTDTPINTNLSYEADFVETIRFDNGNYVKVNTQTSGYIDDSFKLTLQRDGDAILLQRRQGESAFTRSIKTDTVYAEFAATMQISKNPNFAAILYSETKQFPDRTMWTGTSFTEVFNGPDLTNEDYEGTCYVRYLINTLDSQHRLTVHPQRISPTFEFEVSSFNRPVIESQSIEHSVWGGFNFNQRITSTMQLAVEIHYYFRLPGEELFREPRIVNTTLNVGVNEWGNVESYNLGPNHDEPGQRVEGYQEIYFTDFPEEAPLILDTDNPGIPNIVSGQRSFTSSDLWQQQPLVLAPLFITPNGILELRPNFIRYNLEEGPYQTNVVMQQYEITIGGNNPHSGEIFELSGQDSIILYGMSVGDTVSYNVTAILSTSLGFEVLKQVTASSNIVTVKADESRFPRLAYEFKESDNQLLRVEANLVEHYRGEFTFFKNAIADGLELYLQSGVASEVMSTWEDSSDNNNNATLQSYQSPTLLGTIFNPASITFTDHVNRSYIEAPIYWKDLNGNFTMSVATSIAKMDNHLAIGGGKDGYTAVPGVSFGECNNGFLDFGIVTRPMISIPQSELNLDQIYVFTMTCENSQKISLYIDGMLYQTINFEEPFSITGDYKFWLGTANSPDSHSNRYFEGTIYGASLHNRALTAPEVATNFRNTRHGAYPIQGQQIIIVNELGEEFFNQTIGTMNATVDGTEISPITDDIYNNYIRRPGTYTFTSRFSYFDELLEESVTELETHILELSDYVIPSFSYLDVIVPTPLRTFTPISIDFQVDNVMGSVRPDIIEAIWRPVRLRISVQINDGTIIESDYSVTVGARQTLDIPAIVNNGDIIKIQAAVEYEFVIVDYVSYVEANRVISTDEWSEYTVAPTDVWIGKTHSLTFEVMTDTIYKRIEEEDEVIVRRLFVDNGGNEE